jgi:glycerol-3-phosphate dehydrogenase (NAD(P)+)
MKALHIAGAGAFGTALAVVLAKNGVAVTLWARDADHLAEMERARENARHLPRRAPAARHHADP